MQIRFPCTTSPIPSPTANYILNLGDSITNYVNTALQAAKPVGWTIYNRAQDGGSLIAGSGSVRERIQEAIAAGIRPEVVYLKSGANDLRSFPSGGAYLEAQIAELSVLLDWSPETKTVIESIDNRYSEGGGFGAMSALRLQHWEALEIAKAAKRIHGLGASYLDHRIGPDSYAEDPDLAADGTHPNGGEATERMVDVRIGAIQEQLASGGPDTKPYLATPASVTGAALGTGYWSDPIVIEHLGYGQSVDITCDTQMKINGGSAVTSATVSNSPDNADPVTLEIFNTSHATLENTDTFGTVSGFEDDVVFTVRTLGGEQIVPVLSEDGAASRTYAYGGDGSETFNYHLDAGHNVVTFLMGQSFLDFGGTVGLTVDGVAATLVAATTKPENYRCNIWMFAIEVDDAGTKDLVFTWTNGGNGGVGTLYYWGVNLPDAAGTFGTPSEYQGTSGGSSIVESPAVITVPPNGVWLSVAYTWAGISAWDGDTEIIEVSAFGMGCGVTSKKPKASAGGANVGAAMLSLAVG